VLYIGTCMNEQVPAPAGNLKRLLRLKAAAASSVTTTNVEVGWLPILGNRTMSLLFESEWLVCIL
jgi:hypothetical protein